MLNIVSFAGVSRGATDLLTIDVSDTMAKQPNHEAAIDTPARFQEAIYTDRKHYFSGELLSRIWTFFFIYQRQKTK